MCEIILSGYPNVYFVTSSYSNEYILQFSCLYILLPALSLFLIIGIECPWGKGQVIQLKLGYFLTKVENQQIHGN